jgi:hypothetical protein
MKKSIISLKVDKAKRISTEKYNLELRNAELNIDKGEYFTQLEVEAYFERLSKKISKNSQKSNF